MELFKKVRNYIDGSEIEKAILSSDAVLVAYSGGADSSVLLCFLHEYLKDKSISLAAAHLNHMIRGDEAQRDQSFCRAQAEKLGVPFYTKSVNVPEIAKESGKTVEEAARDERYIFLSDIANELGENTVIATAHNSTDNMETVIFNLARGSGTTGVGGIAPVRDGYIIRPLLSVSGEEIRNYANERGIGYVTDSTNNDTSYTRNFVRKNIVPLLKELNPSAEDAVLRLGRITRLEDEYMSQEAQKLICDGGISRDSYRRAHPAMKQRIIRELYRKANGTINGISMANLEICVEFAENGLGKISLPNYMTMFADKDMIYIKKEDARTVPEEIKLNMNGEIVSFGENFAVCLCSKGKEPLYDKNIYNLFIQQSASFDTIYGSIFVRCRREGDRILKGKMHKKLKKLMCDADIPLRYRETLPLFCDGEGILWVPKAALRDKAKGQDFTMYVFTLKG